MRFSDKLEVFEPRVKRVFLSGPELVTAVGQTPLAQNKTHLDSDKKNVEHFFSEATSAQAKECFGSEFLS